MVYIITAGTSRLGQALIRFLHKKGTVYFTYHSAKETAELLVNEGKGNVHSIQLNFLETTPNEVSQTLIRILESAHGKQVTLIHNCSIFEYDSPKKICYDFLDKAYTVNFKVPLILSEAFLNNCPLPGGCIISILDTKLFSLNSDYYSYTIMKSAFADAMHIFSLEAPAHINFYGIAPSMFAESGPLTVGRVEELVQMNPLSYPLSTEDLTLAIDFLSLGLLRSGTILPIDGGQSLWKLRRDIAFSNPQGGYL